MVEANGVVFASEVFVHVGPAIDPERVAKQLSDTLDRLHSAERTLFKVYCAPARVVAAPEEQTVTVEVPSMAPVGS